MTSFRDALAVAVAEARHKLPFVTEIREEAGLLRIVLTLDAPAFNLRKDISDWMLECVIQAFVSSRGQDLALPLFRGVDRAARERALQAGIDVHPTDARWYGSDALEKALEYGGQYPDVLIIDGNCVKRPFRELDANAPEADHAEARAWANSDGMPDSYTGRILYSRLVGPDDGRRGSPYEAAYAYYIPGDAKQALIGIIECRGPAA